MISVSLRRSIALFALWGAASAAASDVRSAPLRFHPVKSAQAAFSPRSVGEHPVGSQGLARALRTDGRSEALFAKSGAKITEAPRSAVLLQLGAGTVAGLIAIPAFGALGSWIGTLSSNLLAAALPALLVFGALPPLAITAAILFAGNWSGARGLHWNPALWVALGTHVAAIVVAAMLGVFVFDFATMAIFTLIDSVATAGATTWMMNWSADIAATTPGAATRMAPFATVARVGF
jgi:hypothetical protein